MRAEALSCTAQTVVDSDPVRMKLASALGGSEFLAGGIVTPLGTRADLLIAMRSGDYPIALSANGNTGEDLFQVGDTTPITSGIIRQTSDTTI